MTRIILTLLMLPLCLSGMGQKKVIVADSISRRPLPNASVFDSRGRFIGTTGPGGSLPAISASEYPVTIRYMGFRETTVSAPAPDTVFMPENVMELTGIVVESRRRKMLHMLAYVREYSDLSTYTDTVSLFREKIVDYMLPVESGTGFNGWSTPRILKSESYYRFTDAHGLDSVSDRCNNHFSWADWVGIPHGVRLPLQLRSDGNGTATLRGKYSPRELWIKDDGRLTVDVDVLADTVGRKWVPGLATFFRKDIDFERLGVRFSYDNATDTLLSPIDLAGYSFNIESHGRGHGMFRFNRTDEPFFVSTYAEVYLIDKEYLTIKEAKKWARLKSGITDGLTVCAPPEAPGLQPSVLRLIARVNDMNHDRTRLALVPDRNLAGRPAGKWNPARAMLQRLKGLVGIDRIAGKRKLNRRWKEFRRERREINRHRAVEPADSTAHGTR